LSSGCIYTREPKWISLQTHIISKRCMTCECYGPALTRQHRCGSEERFLPLAADLGRRDPWPTMLPTRATARSVRLSESRCMERAKSLANIGARRLATVAGCHRATGHRRHTAVRAWASGHEGTRHLCTRVWHLDAVMCPQSGAVWSRDERR
jgi:hypothetical protein